MKRHITIITLLGLGMLLAGCDKKSKEKDMMSGPHDVEVAVPVVDSVTLTHEYPGFITSNSVADVVGRVNGQLLTRNFSEGQYVRKGQVLFTIESSTYRDAVTQAEASLQSARSQYAYASEHYQAMKKALAANAVSSMSVSQAESAMKEASASIKNAEAALHSARTNLGYCTVTAPISGHISASTIDPGAYVSGEGSPQVLATIYDDAVVSAQFAVEESQFEQMTRQNGLNNSLYRNVPLTFKEPLEHPYTADMKLPSPMVDKTTGTLTLKGDINNQYGELKQGMYVSISLPYGTNPHALLINDASIGTDQLGKYVYVVNDSNKVVYTPIKVGGLYQDTLRIVESGLTPQSRYVTKALLTVRNGEKVKPVMRK